MSPGLRILTVLGMMLALNSPTHAGESRDNQDKKANGDTAVKDLPKPIPEVMKKLKDVGNEASKGINRASQGVRDIFDKGTKNSKEPNKAKER
jgi:hypothetical protein